MQKDLRKNKKGGIEGLPLQLMILIIIATLGTAVIVGWMGNIETPQSIGDVTVDTGDVRLTGTPYGGYYGINGSITISVTDQDGNPLDDASVVLTGLGIKDSRNDTVYGSTDKNGCVTFSSLKVKMTGTVGFVTVDVSKAGYGEDSSCRITVIN